MRNFILVFLLWTSTSLFSQSHTYWQMPDSLRKEVKAYFLEKCEIIFVDSVLYHHLDCFYRAKSNSLNDYKPDPGYFGVRPLLVDEEMKNGIFKSRVRSSHADTYIFTFSDNVFKIYDELIPENELFESVNDFLNQNLYLFSGLNVKKTRRELFKEIKKIK